MKKVVEEVHEAYVTADRKAACPVRMVPLTINIGHYTWTMMVPINEYLDARSDTEISSDQFSFGD